MYNVFNTCINTMYVCTLYVHVVRTYVFHLSDILDSRTNNLYLCITSVPVCKLKAFTNRKK